MSSIQPIWGHLKDHHGDCYDEHDDGWCDTGCDNGKIFWGSFYQEDIGECDWCGKEKPIQENYGCGWYCVDCYIQAHKKDCGCDLWRKWE